MNNKISKHIAALTAEIKRLNLPKEHTILISELLNNVNHEADVINFKIKRILQDKSVMTTVLNNTIKELEEKSALLEQQKKVIQEEAKFKENLYAVVSHEMRTPLNGILGMGYLLSGTPLNHSQQKYTEVIKGSVDKLIVIVNDLLNMASVNSGDIKIEKEPFYTAELFNNLEGTLSVKTEKKGIDLSFNTEADFPPCLLGDSTRTYQILLNLLNNAVKFTEQGSVSLHTKVEREKGNVIYVKFVIQDTGIGIKSDKLERIFGPYVQVHDKKAWNEEGMGLGLSIVKKLLNLMDGSITVKSTVNQGTTMTVILPFELPTEQNPLRPEQVSDLFVPKNWREKRFLLLEDNEANVFYIKEVFSGWQLNIDVVSTLEQARLKLAEHQYDCLLSDIHLPDGNGIDFIEELRQSAEIYRHLPAIVLSAEAHLSDDILHKLDIKVCLNKPFTPQSLQSAIHQIFDTQMHNSEHISSKEQADHISHHLIKLSHLYQLFKGKRQHVFELLDLFEAQVPPTLSKLEQHIKDKNKKGIHYEAHTIKSTMKIIGLDNLVGLAIRLEYCESDTWEDIQKNYDSFKGQTLEELKALEKEREMLV